MKYREIILKLENDDLYTPALIAAFAERIGFVEGEDLKERKLARLRIRVSMGRFSNNRFFPDEGDGFVTIPGQAPTPAWFGWRWKGALYY